MRTEEGMRGNLSGEENFCGMIIMGEMMDEVMMMGEVMVGEVMMG